jgi:hypothetical protein
MRTSRAALVRMRLYGVPPPEGGVGGEGGWDEEAAFISDFRQIYFVFKFLHSCTFLVNSDPHPLHNCIGPKSTSDSPSCPLHSTFPKPLHTNCATDFNTERSEAYAEVSIRPSLFWHVTQR